MHRIRQDLQVVQIHFRYGDGMDLLRPVSRAEGDEGHLPGIEIAPQEPELSLRQEGIAVQDVLPFRKGYPYGVVRKIQEPDLRALIAPLVQPVRHGHEILVIRVSHRIPCLSGNEFIVDPLHSAALNDLHGSSLSQLSRGRKRKFRSTLPPMPGTVPVKLYCQKSAL